mmetsp:Transcript_24352/g.36092  ORF Transcript_24352/g.36092 Transcript_24352/m.36092 type:complete len:574 (+) Transcript_24352:152-1873(+)
MASLKSSRFATIRRRRLHLGKETQRVSMIRPVSIVRIILASISIIATVLVFSSFKGRPNNNFSTRNKLTSSSVAQSIPQVTSIHQPIKACVNSESFRYLDNNKHRNCRNIRMDSKRREDLCRIDAVNKNCPQTCGSCCQDLDDFFFIRTRNLIGTCKWLNENDRRKGKYCNYTEMSYDGRTIRDGCPVTCNFCFSKIEVQKEIDWPKLIINPQTEIEGQKLIVNPTDLDPQGNKQKQLDVTINNSSLPLPVRKWAYAFLVGGCDREEGHHKGFLANIIVSAKKLQMDNSTADVVALIQMSYKSKYDTLSEDEKILMEAMGIKIKYIPKFSSAIHEMFYELTMQKFHILDLTEYSRVLFMDADVMPLVSMDYIFELSEPASPEITPPSLMENMVVSWKNEPASAGFFMLKPSHEDFIRAQEIIRNTESLALEQPWPHFDEELGFGHKIDDSDPWEANLRGRFEKGTKWTWHCAFSDQGFLYHWVKYEKKNVSIINGNRIQHFSTSDYTGGGNLQMTTLSNKGKEGVLNSHSGMYGTKHGNNQVQGPDAPKVDFIHFVGKSKPWHYIDRTKKTRW